MYSDFPILSERMLSPMDHTKPIIALTMGDGAGVGPEIIVQALAHPDIYDHCRPFVIGDLKILQRAEGIRETGCQFHVIKNPADALFTFGTIDCLDICSLPIFLLAKSMQLPGMLHSVMWRRQSIWPWISKLMPFVQLLSTRKRCTWGATIILDIPKFWRILQALNTTA